MRHTKRYRITITEQSRLETVAKATFSIWSIAGLFFAGILVSSFLAGIFIMASPLRELLPGYLKKSERSASEENLLKLDSIYTVFRMNQAYIDNLLRVTDINRNPEDSVMQHLSFTEVSPDSLLSPSNDEENFQNMMRQREKYHLSVLAPLASERMVFVPVSETGVFLSESKDQETGIIAMSDTGEISAIADAAILAVYFSPSENGYVVVMQHPQGFASRLSRLGHPLVSPGDIVSVGQAIALQSHLSGTKGNIITVQMWHDGLPLVPYQYLGDGSL